jgi:(1->4)-alpha-D-glucan 1-alpha-D-glucosylmutase
MYQGTEFWDFSLVDPDNRRPVDFSERSQALEQRRSFAGNWPDGHSKQQLIARILTLRQRKPQLFALGTYEALEVVGLRSNKIVAFRRHYQGEDLLVIVPIHCGAELADANSLAPAPSYWNDTRVILPSRLHKLHEIVTNISFDVPAGVLTVGQHMASLPLMICTAT